VCPHYRVKTYETLAHYYDVDFLFFSQGNEDYWETRTGARSGSFKYEYLPGFNLTRKIRIVPSLISRLWRGNYDVIVKCITGRFALPAAYGVARLRGKPFVLWTGLWTHPRTLFHRLTFPMTRFFYSHADAIVVYGRHVKEYLVSLGIDPRKIFVAWHAHDNDQFQPASAEEVAALRERYGAQGHKVILFVGRLEKVKGLPYLIEALAQLNLPTVKLLLVGTGSEEQSLKDLCARRGLHNVVFAGYVPVEQLNPYYSLADVFVLPSITVPAGRELWGLVINEAMNFSLPVIVTDAVGAAAGGLVLDGVDGLVVREQDSGELAQALARLLGSEAERASMGQMAKQIISGWDNEKMVQGFRAAIEYAYAHHHHARKATAPKI
jgi:glycosyltransferase involved in cell wall biosynthesis